MNKAEAIETCEAWFAHNERQRENSFEMQRLASLARTGPEGAKEARKKLANIDRAPVVFDGARLEPAVRFLVNAVLAPDYDAIAKRLAEAERERDRLRGYWQRVLRQSEDCEAIVFDYEELQRIMLECRTPDSANAARCPCNCALPDPGKACAGCGRVNDGDAQ